MNLVQAALRRPVTVLVLAIAVVLGAALALTRMPRDIFPTLGIPTIYVAQPYGGMDPAQMEGFLTYYYEYHFLYITGIEHVESKSIQGASIMKLQFYPGTDMNQAMAETVGYVNRSRAFMPPGTVPPFITRFDAGSVPVGNLVFTSETATVAQMQDAALNRVRPLFATLPGVSAPPPFGGSARTILINVDPERLRSYNMSPDEIVSAITRANLISPSGNMSVDGKHPMVAELRRHEHQGPRGRADPRGHLSDGVRPRRRTSHRRLRHRHELRPRQRPAHRVRARHEARGRLDADRRRSRQGELAALPGRGA